MRLSKAWLGSGRKARQGKTGQAGQGMARHGKAGQDRARQGKTGLGRARQSRAGQGRAGQGRAGQGRAVNELNNERTYRYHIYWKLVKLVTPFTIIFGEYRLKFHSETINLQIICN